MRIDIPLNSGYRLVLLFDPVAGDERSMGERLYVRLLSASGSRPTFLVPKLAITGAQLRLLAGTEPYIAVLGSLRLIAAETTIAAQTEGHSAWGGRAALRLAVRDMLASLVLDQGISDDECD